MKARSAEEASHVAGAVLPPSYQEDCPNLLLSVVKPCAPSDLCTYLVPATGRA